MRRSASEIIRNLENRIAHLEDMNRTAKYGLISIKYVVEEGKLEEETKNLKMSLQDLKATVKRTISSYVFVLHNKGNIHIRGEGPDGRSHLYLVKVSTENMLELFQSVFNG